MSHRPGPWEQAGHLIRTPFKGKGGGFLIADCSHTNLDGKANARLIAAAPEMLEALKGVVRVADRNTVEFDAARAAIAKAEGKA